MFINFTDRELAVIKELALQKDISEEKVVIQALRLYQLYALPTHLDESPGCGLIE